MPLAYFFARTPTRLSFQPIYKIQRNITLESTNYTYVSSPTILGYTRKCTHLCNIVLDFKIAKPPMEQEAKLGNCHLWSINNEWGDMHTVLNACIKTFKHSSRSNQWHSPRLIGQNAAARVCQLCLTSKMQNMFRLPISSFYIGGGYILCRPSIMFRLSIMSRLLRKEKFDHTKGNYHSRVRVELSTMQSIFGVAQSIDLCP